jgi:hypothetical protein
MKNKRAFKSLANAALKRFKAFRMNFLTTDEEKLRQVYLSLPEQESISIPENLDDG